jgi:uncharacterized Tic20 family protein
MANEAPVGDKVSAGGPPSKEACTWAMLCHILGLGWVVVPAIGGVIGALIIWQIKKDLLPFADQHGKEALNFQISMLIYGAIAGLLIMAFGLGLVLVPVVIIADVVFAIIAAVKAAQGETYRYPLSIRFVA